MHRVLSRQLYGFAMVLAVACAAAAFAQDAASTIPWDLAALSQAPQTWPADGFFEKGVRALFYTGQPFAGKPTRVFAWYGAPEVPAGEKVPAMVLVHGGGGTAFAEWVRLWTSRGYAAIAMDTCGCVPKGTYSHWERHPDGGPAGRGGFDQIEQPVQDQWTYHAIADVLLAHSLICSFPEVDAARTGVTGISWGGYLTCIAAGVDNRFRCAVPVYGCGFLGKNSAWLDTFAGMTTENRAKWLGLWDPSVYLPGAGMPTLWVTGTNDFAYPMDSLQKSYRLPSGPHTLCLRVRMPHGHGGAGENPEEIHAFADSFLRGGTPLAKLVGQGREEGKAWAVVESQAPIASAEFTYTKDEGKWQDRNWEIQPAALETIASTEPAAMPKYRASIALPEGVKVYYFNFASDKGLVVSSEHEVVAE